MSLLWNCTGVSQGTGFELIAQVSRPSGQAGTSGPGLPVQGVDGRVELHACMEVRAGAQRYITCRSGEVEEVECNGHGGGPASPGKDGVGHRTNGGRGACQAECRRWLGISSMIRHFRIAADRCGKRDAISLDHNRALYESTWGDLGVAAPVLEGLPTKVRRRGRSGIVHPSSVP